MMPKLLSSKDEDSIFADIESLRQTRGGLTFYYVVEQKSSTSGNPIDAVFGEPINPFTEPDTARTYVSFSASIMTKVDNSEFDHAGFEEKLQMELEVDRSYKEKLDFQMGTLLMREGVYWRVTDLDPRGLIDKGRFILTVEQVS